MSHETTKTGLTGMGVSSGIAIGKVYLLEREKIHISKQPIKQEQVERDQQVPDLHQERHRRADHIKESIPDDEIRKHAFIIDAHVLMLQDQFFRRK